MSSCKKDSVASLASSLLEAIEAEAASNPSLQSQYNSLKKSLASFLSAIEGDSAEEPLYQYEYQTVSYEGSQLFTKKYDTVSVAEAQSLLGFNINETMIRNMIHYSDYFIVIKTKTEKNNTRMLISKQSVMNLKKRLKSAKDLESLRVYRAQCRKQNRTVQTVITLDKDLAKTLKKYVVV